MSGQPRGGARAGPTDLRGRRALVVGLGVSGAAAARALLTAGADVVAVDRARAGPVSERAGDLAGAGVEVHLDWDGQPPSLSAYDLVVPSPGVPESHPVLAAAAAAGLAVWSEPELAWRLSGGRTRLVAVTGTNGKTTTTELLASCLEAPAAGNIGEPLVQALSDRPPLVVAELSSFQLRFCDSLAPAVAVLLNVAPDHLDWHTDEVAYGDAKARIWQHQGADGLAVVNRGDPGARAVLARHPPPGRVVGFGLDDPASTVAGEVGVRAGAVVVRAAAGEVEVVEVDALRPAAPHHLENVCAAVAAAVGAGADPSALGPRLRAFRPGPHRLEHVATVDGVDWVNDSKATNPHAAAAALGAYPRVVWIAGGLAKGVGFEPLRPLLGGRVRAVVTIGQSGPAIAALARAAGVPVVEAGRLARAVPAAAGLARPGDTVLLAPACASMDQFGDYAERGRAFRDAVAALARAAGAAPGVDAGPSASDTVGEAGGGS